MEELNLPAPPEGYEYRLMKKRPRQTVSLSEVDPSKLTPKQLAGLKYREKNKEKIIEYRRRYMETKKNENL